MCSMKKNIISIDFTHVKRLLTMLNDAKSMSIKCQVLIRTLKMSSIVQTFWRFTRIEAVTSTPKVLVTSDKHCFAVRNEFKDDLTIAELFAIYPPCTEAGTLV